MTGYYTWSPAPDPEYGEVQRVWHSPTLAAARDRAWVEGGGATARPSARRIENGWREMVVSGRSWLITRAGGPDDPQPYDYRDAAGIPPAVPDLTTPGGFRHGSVYDHDPDFQTADPDWEHPAWRCAEDYARAVLGTAEPLFWQSACGFRPDLTDDPAWQGADERARLDLVVAAYLEVRLHAKTCPHARYRADTAAVPA